jgi:putative spermidine/putrescine transport system permease protein
MASASAAWPRREGRRRQLVASPGAWLVWGAVAFFLVNLAALVTEVVINSFGTRWFDAWLPEGLTTRWYSQAWSQFAVFDTLVVTLEVSLAVVAISLVVGVPAAYALARREFPGKRLLMLALLVPLVLPPLSYGIPLATVLYEARMAGTLAGVILANLVPAVPFVVLVMTPFVEQVDPNIESAARMCGAGTRRVLTRVLVPLLIPGILAAGLLVLVRTVAMFELTFLTAGPDSQTLVVALYNAAFAAGIRTDQTIDAMAVFYMLTTLVLLLIALRFINPTQLVSRVREEPVK